MSSFNRDQTQNSQSSDRPRGRWDKQQKEDEKKIVILMALTQQWKIEFTVNCELRNLIYTPEPLLTCSGEYFSSQRDQDTRAARRPARVAIKEKRRKKTPRSPVSRTNNAWDINHCLNCAAPFLIDPHGTVSRYRYLGGVWGLRGYKKAPNELTNDFWRTLPARLAYLPRSSLSILFIVK